MTGKEDIAKLRKTEEERGDYIRRPGHSTSVHLTTGDYDMVLEIMETIGCGRSEAIRTSIRVYFALLKQGK